MNIPGNLWKKGIITAIFSGCWSYAWCARFAGIIGAPRQEKLLLFGTALLISSLPVSILVYRIIPHWLDVIRKRIIYNTLLISAGLAAALLLIISQPPPFPESHCLELRTLNKGNPDSAGYWVSVLSVEKDPIPQKTVQKIYMDEMYLQGDWQVQTGDSMVWQGGEQGIAKYQAFMQAGIEIAFQTGPEQGILQIKWDGKEQVIDLYAPQEGIHIEKLKPYFDLYRADSTRRLLVFTALLTEFLSLSVLIAAGILFLTIKKKNGWCIRNLKGLITCSSILLGLFFINFSLLAPIQIEDHNLERVIREVLEKPDQPIFRNELLSIVVLDASGRNISSLEGIQQLRNLSDLNLRDNDIRDITPLSDLNALSRLNLRGNDVTDLSPLSGLANLTYLNLHSNSGITNILPLQNLTMLETLILRGVHIGNQINILPNFPHLNYLNLRDTGISEIKLLGEMMAKGILQDDPTKGVPATVNILDNQIFNTGSDSFEPIRAYWENISYRAPFILPEYNTLDSPELSHEAGYYSESFLLEISTPDQHANIHYSLDGSEPTRYSPLYSGPILIRSRQGEPNHLSTIVTWNSRLEIPENEIFKATVVRAKSFDASYRLTSPSVTRTYFIEETISEKFSLPVVSLTANSEHLYDIVNGIYRHYDEKGSLWERPVHIELFEAGGSPVLAAKGIVRIQGEGSNGYPQKSLRIFAQPGEESNSTFSYSFFSGVFNQISGSPISEYKNIILRNSGNDWYRSLFGDALMHSLMSYTSLDTQAYRPVIGFINGEYWGIYNLRQRIDEYYFAFKYGIDPEEISIMTAQAGNYYDGLGVFRGPEEEESNYKQMLEFISSEKINEQEIYDRINALMDIDNFINYQIAEIYCANADWPHSNIMWWRKTTDEYQPDAPLGHDGRWRWILIDTDLGFGWEKYGSYGHHTLETAIQNPKYGKLFRSLLKSERFRQQFINNFVDHLNTTFRSERVIKKIDEMQSTLEPEIAEHIERWRTMDDSIETWKNNVDSLRDFASNRPQIVRNHLSAQFGLAGTAELTLQTNPAYGFIQVNSVAITTDTPGVIDAGNWSGIYFKDFPIQITAIPLPGYKFMGWDGLKDKQDQESITIQLQNDLILTANFAPLP